MINELKNPSEISRKCKKKYRQNADSMIKYIYIILIAKDGVNNEKNSNNRLRWQRSTLR